MKNKEIVTFFNIRNKLKSKSLPMKLAFALKLNYERLQSCADIYNEQFAEIRKKYASGENQAVKQDELQAFTEEIEELLNIEVSCDKIQKVDFSIFEKCDSEQFDSLTVEELEALSFMIG